MKRIVYATVNRSVEEILPVSDRRPSMTYIEGISSMQEKMIQAGARSIDLIYLLGNDRFARIDAVDSSNNLFVDLRGDSQSYGDNDTNLILNYSTNIPMGSRSLVGAVAIFSVDGSRLDRSSDLLRSLDCDVKVIK